MKKNVIITKKKYNSRILRKNITLERLFFNKLRIFLLKYSVTIENIFFVKEL